MTSGTDGMTHTSHVLTYCDHNQDLINHLADQVTAALLRGTRATGRLVARMGIET